VGAVFYGILATGADGVFSDFPGMASKAREYFLSGKGNWTLHPPS
jgi:hypothetical protein